MPCRRLFLLSVLALFVSGIGSPARSMSVVADLDSNAANGPDTLAVVVGDTVLVRIWITESTDSLFGFGLTVGETTGVLSWVEEAAGEIMVVPDAWSAFFDYQEDQGLLLLQPYDFTMSAPLHLPAEIARLHYVAVDSGVCGTMVWDSTQSGWQNTEFAEGTFAGFEGATVCVAGGDDGGGGEEDSPPGQNPPVYQLIAISNLMDEELAALTERISLEVVAYESGSPVRIVMLQESVAQLVEEGYDVTVLDADYGEEYFDPDVDGVPSWARTYGGVVAFLDSMHDEYPELTTEKDSIGASWEDSTIWAMRVGKAGEGEKPAVLYDALHHANEAVTVNVVLDYMRHLLENYGTDPEATFLVDEREIWFVPIVNPDGYVFIEQGGSSFWRKNRRYNGGMCDTIPSYGVDLNRNYGFQWGGGSSDSCSPSYQGPASFSEPETRAMRDFILDKEFVAGDSYHSDIRALLYPWAYSTAAPEDSARFTAVAGERTRWNNYRSWQAGRNAYTRVSGSSIDWAYDTRGVFAFATEVGGTDKWPDAAEIPYLVSEQLSSSIVLSLVAGSYVAVAEAEVLDGGDDGQLDAGETDSLVVTLTNWGLNASATSVCETLLTDDPYIELHLAAASLGTISAGDSAKNSGSPFVIEVDPETPAGHRAVFTVRSNWSSGYPHEETITLTVGDPAVIDSLSDDFEEADDRWNVSGDATAGTWVRGDPVRGSFQPGDDTTPDPGSLAWVTDEATGDQHNVNGGTTTLLSPTWDLSAFPSVTLRLNYFFGQQTPEDDAGDFFLIDLSNNNGGTFPESLLVIGDVGHNAVWSSLEVNLDEVLQLTNQMRIRIQAADGSGSSDMIEAGIDDLVLIDRGTGNHPPGAPTLVSPVGGDYVEEDPDLRIGNASDPDADTLTYGFHVYSDVLLTDLVRSAYGVAEGTSETSWTVSPPLSDGTYWWRAYADDDEERGLFTNLDSFVVTATGVATGEAMPRFAVFPPRPNPTPTMSTIHLLVPGTGRVEADVFDVAGRRVRVLYRGLMEGGAQTLSWDGRDQRGNPAGPGVYFVRVRNENKEEAIKTVRVR